MVVLIDLDAAPPPPPPRRSRLHGARLVLPGLAVVLILLLGGAAAPPFAGLTEVAGTGDQRTEYHLVTTAALYTAQPRANVTLLDAIPLVAGGPRWSVTVAATDATIALSADRSTIMAVPHERGWAVFVDARTGRVRWKVPAFGPLGVVGDRVVVWQPPGMLRMADVETGRTRWQQPAGADTLAVDDRWVVALDQSGRGKVFASPNGAVLTDKSDLSYTDNGDGYGGAVILGDALYWWTSTVVAAYRLPELTPLWRMDAGQTLTVEPCGALVCALGNGGVIAADPATGKEGWTNLAWRALTGEVAVTGDGRAQRADLSTGRALEELGRGAPVGDLLIRLDGDRGLAIRLGSRAVLGELPPVDPALCSMAGRYLACPVDGGAVTVWRVR